MDGFTRFIREFLKAHPECIADHEVMPVRGRDEHMLNLHSLPTFLEWVVRTRRIDPVKALELDEWFRRRFPGQKIRAVRLG